MYTSRSAWLGVGRVVRRYLVSFQCLDVFLIQIRVGQGPIALEKRCKLGCLEFSIVSYLFFSPSLGDGPIDWNTVSKGNYT